MIGMSQIKKKFYTGIGIGAGVGLIGMITIGGVSLATINSYKEGTNKEYNKMFLTQVSVLNRNILQGQTITPEMVTSVTMHKSMVPSNISQNFVGQTAKYNLAANMTITEDMLATDIIAFDIRRQEINTVLLPSDLISEGEIIDVRINFPNGTDYTVLIAKEVKAINGSTIWLDLSEFETQLLNSAVVDSYLNNGTKLYATKYVDPAMQISYEVDENDSATTLSKDQLVKNELQKIITDELPSLKITDTDEGSNAETASKIFDFIKKYNDLTAVTTTTARTYDPNMQVINAIDSNKNITQIAKDTINERNRTIIEQLNKEYYSQNEEILDEVVEKAQGSIDEQEALRNSILGLDGSEY